MSGITTLAGLLSLQGKVALVTGARGGIGSAVVTLLSDAGAAVVAADRVECASPPGGWTFTGDLSDAATVARLLGGCRDQAGRLDVLVHCAGIRRDAVLWKLEAEAWAEVLRVNLDSAFLLLKEAVPLMRGTGGSVVLVSSINGERGKFGQANYSASKAGLIGLGRTAARELGRFNIRVNVVAPGMIRTPMTGTLPAQVVQDAAEESVLGRIGEPEDVARVILFLASDMSRHVTGQVVRVDGGQMIG